jgi:hypothetical protein
MFNKHGEVTEEEMSFTYWQCSKVLFLQHGQQHQSCCFFSYLYTVIQDTVPPPQLNAILGTKHPTMEHYAKTCRDRLESTNPMQHTPKRVGTDLGLQVLCNNSYSVNKYQNKPPTQTTIRMGVHSMKTAPCN